MPVSLVTGANRGIGREVARQLAAEHGHAVLLTARDLGKAEDAAEALRKNGLGDGRVAPLQLDVTAPESVATAAEAVEREQSHLDALVNNAGVDYDTDQHVLTADVERAGRALDTNTLGPWRVAQAFLPLLREAAPGRVVNVSSGSGAWRSLGSGTPGYSLSKAALNALTVMMASALEDEGVLVNAVGPGWVRTDMGGEQANRSIPEGARSIVWGATLGPDGPTGGFFRDGEEIGW
ncbi:MAG: short-chain dehydrogenase [Bacteroidetes bacterium QS_9_68_14]|nr:MAG: short-chain dehydrogenase [Bacteroidetes bacterium QS_9_68_14]